MGLSENRTNFPSPDFLRRADAATALCHAIAECNRDDAVVILEAALSDLSLGSPLPVFISAMEDARWWASYAAPQELKAFALAAFDEMRPQVRAAFLSHIQPSAAT